MAKTDFQYGRWNSYTLQCSMIMTLILPDNCTLQCGMWLWNHDSKLIKWQYPVMWYAALGRHATEFARWQHPAMWQVALGWHAIEFAQTSAILEFYICLPFPHITVVDMSFCTSLRNFIQIGPPSAEKMTSCRFSRSQPSWIVEIQ